MTGIPVYAMMAPELIRRDGGTQSRVGLDESAVAEYAEAMADGAEFPPLLVFATDAGYHWLADGFHRLAAHDRARPGEEIRCEVRKGSLRDAMLYAAGANASHGLRRSREDKRKAVRTLLLDQEWGRWSSREIARQCHVSHTFVDKVRWEIMDEDGAGDTGNVAGERVYTDRHGNETVMQLPKAGGDNDIELQMEGKNLVPGIRSMFRAKVLAPELIARLTRLGVSDQFAFFDAMVEAGYKESTTDDMTVEATAALDEIEAFDAPVAAGDGDRPQDGDEDPALIGVAAGEPFRLPDGRTIRVVEVTCTRSERYAENRYTGWRVECTSFFSAEYTPDDPDYTRVCNRAAACLDAGIAVQLCIQPGNTAAYERLLVLEARTASDRVWRIEPGAEAVAELVQDAPGPRWVPMVYRTDDDGAVHFASGHKTMGGEHATMREAEEELQRLAVENGWEPASDGARTAMVRHRGIRPGDIFTGGEPSIEEARKLQDWRFRKIVEAEQAAEQDGESPLPLAVIAAHMERIRESARVIEDLVDGRADIESGGMKQAAALARSVNEMTRAALALEPAERPSPMDTGLSEPVWVSADEADELMDDRDWRNAAKITGQLDVFVVCLDLDRKRILQVHPDLHRLEVVFEGRTQAATVDEFRRVTDSPDEYDIKRVFCESVPGFRVYCTREEYPLAGSTRPKMYSIWARFDTPEAHSWHLAKRADGTPLKYESAEERDAVLAELLSDPFALEA